MIYDTQLELDLLKPSENHIADCPLCLAAIRLRFGGATTKQIYDRKCEIGKKLWDEFINPYIVEFLKEENARRL